jgi:hypothetical protein
MLKKPLPQQTELEMVTLEGLVPKDHLLRKVEAVIDFSFIHDRVAGLYCPDNGRPPLDPTVMFKAPPRPGMMASKVFTYEADVDGYRCPQGQLLTYATTDRTGYRHYKSDPAICRICPLLASCTSSRNATRLITRHVWADARERIDAHRLTPWGKRIYKRRKETVERSFADAKQLHGHRYALPRSPRRLLPVSARRPRPEHQENCSRAGPPAHTRLNTAVQPLHTLPKQKPRRKIDGVCQRSGDRLRAVFFVGAEGEEMRFRTMKNPARWGSKGRGHQESAFR